MIPSPYNILCVGIIWFIYTIKTFFKFLNCKLNFLIHLIKLSFISFLYNSEKEYFSYINKLKSVKYPINFAIVLNKFLIKEEKIIESLCRLIKWISLTNHIQYFTIYDAFNLVDINKLITEITEEVNNNSYIYENIQFHFSFKYNKTESIIEKIIEFNKDKKEDKENKKEKFIINICLIGFKEANNNLVKKIIKEKETKVYGNYPEIYKWFNNKNDNKSDDNKDKKLFQKFLTRKNEISLPELIVTFGKNKYLFYEDICLYGFPFTLLENAEIININHRQFDHIDILDFIDIFNKNSKIVKRFGA
jgi:hypothetical protein